MSTCSEKRPYGFKSDDAACVEGAGYKFGSDDKHVTIATAKTDKVIGVCQTQVGQVLAAEDPLELALPGGGAKILLHGTVTRGDELVFDGTGYVTAVSTDWVSAKAMGSGTSGQFIGAEVCGYFKA